MSVSAKQYINTFCLSLRSPTQNIEHINITVWRY